MIDVRRRQRLHHSHGGRFFQTVTRPLASDASEREITGWCRTILTALDLGRFEQARAGNLPYGTLKRVEIARALAPSRACCCSTSRPRA